MHCSHRHISVKSVCVLDHNSGTMRTEYLSQTLLNPYLPLINSLCSILTVVFFYDIKNLLVPLILAEAHGSQNCKHFRSLEVVLGLAELHRISGRFKDPPGNKDAVMPPHARRKPSCLQL